MKKAPIQALLLFKAVNYTINYNTPTKKIRSWIFHLRNFGAGGGIRTPVGFHPNGFQEIDGISHFVPNTPYSLGFFSQKSPFFARFSHFCEKIARKMRENYTHN